MDQRFLNRLVAKCLNAEATFQRVEFVEGASDEDNTFRLFRALEDLESNGQLDGMDGLLSSRPVIDGLTDIVVGWKHSGPPGGDASPPLLNGRPVLEFPVPVIGMLAEWTVPSGTLVEQVSLTAAPRSRCFYSLQEGEAMRFGGYYTASGRFVQQT